MGRTPHSPLPLCVQLGLSQNSAAEKQKDFLPLEDPPVRIKKASQLKPAFTAADVTGSTAAGAVTALSSPS